MQLAWFFDCFRNENDCRIGMRHYRFYWSTTIAIMKHSWHWYRLSAKYWHWRLLNTFIGRRVRITVENDRLSIFFGIFAKRRSTRFNTICYWLNLRTQKRGNWFDSHYLIAPLSITANASVNFRTSIVGATVNLSASVASV